jgi:hypothetical protein
LIIYGGKITTKNKQPHPLEINGKISVKNIEITIGVYKKKGDRIRKGNGQYDNNFVTNFWEG